MAKSAIPATKCASRPLSSSSQIYLTNAHAPRAFVDSSNACFDAEKNKETRVAIALVDDIYGHTDALRERIEGHAREGRRQQRPERIKQRSTRVC